MKYLSTRVSCLASLLLSGATLLSASSAFAQDHLLTFGGGPNPQYNQVSLEKNILYYEKVLTTLGFKGTPHELFFADGGTSLHTVKFQIADGSKDAPDLTIADLFSNADDMATRYRSTILRNINGPANGASLNNWFDTTGKTLKPHDNFYFYFTGHGGEGTDTSKSNTTMDLWSSQPERVHEFTKLLDKLDPAVDVTLFMVQCHSGGFANVIYKDSDPSKGLSPQHRIGFFSTTYPHLAAGCTSVMNEDEYRDFSTFFFSALTGKSRTGKTVEKPDYDKKGFTSYNDAFCYVLLNDDTIDIPIITSDQFLSDFSRVKGVKDKDSDELLGTYSPFSEVLAAATPAQHAVLEGLSTQLKLTGDARVKQAQDVLSQVERDRRSLQRSSRDSAATLRRARGLLMQALTSRFPELTNPWREDAQLILRTQFPTVRDFVTSLPAFKDLTNAVKTQEETGGKDYELELKSVLANRFLDRAQSVIYAANLPKVAKPEIVAEYAELAKRENSAFAPSALASAK